MSKIVLDSVASGFDLSKINSNFQKIQDEFNDKTLYRDNPVGEDNTLQTNIDANGRRIFNLPDPVANGEPVTKGFLTTEIGDMQEQVLLAQGFAEDAQESAEDAQASAESAAASLAEVEKQLDSVGPTLYPFSGDGIEDTFALGIVPLSEDYLDVYVDGAFIPPTEYELVNNLIIFDTPPPSGVDNVQVKVSATVAVIVEQVEDWGLITASPDATDDYGSII